MRIRRQGLQELRVGRSRQTAEFNHPRNAQTSSHWAEIEAFGRRADRSLDGGFRHVILDMISALRIERHSIAGLGGKLARMGAGGDHHGPRSHFERRRGDADAVPFARDASC